MMLNANSLRMLVLFALIGFSNGVIAQQPVIPGATGFGMNTPAGRGGEIFRVTNLNDSGQGSLRACVAASGPRVCIFEVSGTIRLNSNLVVTNPNLTIAGQTAPAPGIMLRGVTLVIKASDVLVQHIAVRPGDDPGGPAPDSRDSIAIGTSGAAVRNVVLDHCSVSWSIDENMSAYKNTDNVTISNSIIAQPLNFSLHSKDDHGYGVLLASDNQNSKFSLIGNLFAHNEQRNPRSNVVDFVFVNNVVYNAGSIALMLFNKSGNPSNNSIVGNVFINGQDGDPDPIRLTGPSDAGGGEMLLGTRIYLSDNTASGSANNQWSMVYNKSDLSQAQLQVTSAPAWPAGLSAWPTANGTALDHVLTNAGSRPAQRNSVDTRVISEVINGTGRTINCVADDGSSRCAKNAGGWPQLASNVRPLSVPNNPSGDSDGDGYTNLEEWLHDMAAEVEGGFGAAGPPPPDDAVRPKAPDWQD